MMAKPIDNQTDFDAKLKYMFSAKRAQVAKQNDLPFAEGSQAKMQQIALRREQLQQEQQQEQREHKVIQESHIVNAHRNKGVGGWRSRQDFENARNLVDRGIWPNNPMGEDDAELLQAMVDECNSVLQRYTKREPQ